MSQIAIANLFLKVFNPAISNQFDGVLRERYEMVKRSNNGKTWHIGVPLHGEPLEHRVNLMFFVKPTLKVLPHVEDELLSLGHFPDELPECAIINTARGRQEDLDACAILCKLIETEFGALTKGANLSR